MNGACIAEEDGQPMLASNRDHKAVYYVRMHLRRVKFRAKGAGN